MRLALAEASAAALRGEVPVGAVVLSAGAVVAQAGNDREATQDPTGHAELRALVAAAKALGRWRLSGCTLVVTLEPCAMCAGAIVNARLDRVVIGAMDARAGGAGSVFDILQHKQLNHRAAVQSGLLAEQSVALLQQFFASRRRAAAGANKKR